MSKKVCIFASGSGTNFEALVKEQYDNIDICLLVCDNKEAYVLERAKKYNIDTYLVETKGKKKETYEKEILDVLKEKEIDFICLAGYMRIIGKTLLDTYSNRIINIHPALLPSFKGAHGIKDAYDYGVKIMGVTVHYIDDTIDGGKIIAQDCFKLTNETLEEAEIKIHEIEHKLYPSTLKEVLK